MNKIFAAGAVAALAGAASAQVDLSVELFTDSGLTNPAVNVDPSVNPTLFGQVTLTGSPVIDSFEFGLESSAGVNQNWNFDAAVVAEYDAFGIGLFNPVISGTSIDNIGGARGFGPGLPGSFVVGTFEVTSLSAPGVLSYSLTDGGFPAARILINNTDQTVNFSSDTVNLIPAPGAAGLLGVAGLAATRRRR